MRSTRVRMILLLVVVGGAACASAGERLQQGSEAEARGDYAQATSRYTDALEKDATLSEARTALFTAWDSAVASGLREASLWEGQGDALAAAEEFRTLDGLRSKAGRVGVSLAVPADYPARRRATFDRAISSLLDLAGVQRAQRRWEGARSAYRRIRSDFDPSPSQRQSAIEAEADALLDWAGAEALDARFQASYRLATDALAVSDQLPATMVDAARDLQEQALGLGLRVLAVFPVETTYEVGADPFPELEAQLTDVLELDHWRRPPYFVAVADPAAVRRATRRVSPPGAPLRPGRILDSVGADFGALLQITDVRIVEEDVKSREVLGRTRDGRRATYGLEEGKVRYAVTVRGTLLDGDGRELDTFESRAGRTGRFERGVYGGDPQNLDLSRGERRLFDAREQQIQRGETVDLLVAELAEKLADGVFERVLRRIP
ncbi:MAG TPA: hypothetical protein VLA36_13905 [Longimicrobiales bacterium]|nr:hypothetical protein [Longimicrobiales bacterium]